MIFSENPYDRSIERLMTQIPNFKPRGGGLFFSKLKLTKQSCSCSLCPNYKRKTGCTRNSRYITVNASPKSKTCGSIPPHPKK